MFGSPAWHKERMPSAPFGRGGRARAKAGSFELLTRSRHVRKREVAISPELHLRLLSYIDHWSVEPHALVFDNGRLHAEHTEVREKRELPKRFPCCPSLILPMMASSVVPRFLV